MNAEAGLRTRARELLEKKKVAGVLGFRRGSRSDTCVPFLATDPEQAEQLVVEPTCSANLAAYLPRLRGLGRIAVVARGSESRSIVNLVKENQVDRGKLHIIGIVDPDENCRVRNPVVYDELLGDPAPESADDDYADVAEFEKQSSAERWGRLVAEFSRCIRCYACRQVCPNCYCPTCFVDASRPAWVGRTPDSSDNVMFHVVRALHMAGRCVECGACEKACPVGIPLMLINRKVSRIVRDRFDHVSGMDPDDALPLTAFRPDDEEEFIAG